MRTVILSVFAMLLFWSVDAQTPVKWYSIEEAFALNQKAPRKIMIDVYTDWCGWCKVMDSKTFSNPVIAEYLNKNFYPVKLNAEQKENISLYGKTFKFVNSGSRGYHELAATLLNGQMSYPSVVFLNEKTQMIQPIQGYIQAKEFDTIIKFIGDDTYKTQKWNDFQAIYVSPIQ